MTNMNDTAQLLLHCPDQPGIVAEVTKFITENNGNIVYLDQYVDRAENIFFMRIEWELADFLIPADKIQDYFQTLYAQKYGTFILFATTGCFGCSENQFGVLISLQITPCIHLYASLCLKMSKFTCLFVFLFFG